MFLKAFILLLLSLFLGGCEGRLLVAGNVFFLGITCWMLWSTINLGRTD